jgi:hypothetical protein
MEDNIHVVLSTSRQILSIDGDVVLTERIKNFKPIPICYARCETGITIIGRNSEKMELSLAEICKRMVNKVLIKKPKVIIGENLDDEESWLIDYEEKKPTEITEMFFEEFKKTNTLHMQFSAFDPLRKRDLFCVCGLYHDGVWEELEILPSSKIHFIPTTMNN